MGFITTEEEEEEEIEEQELRNLSKRFEIEDYVSLFARLLDIDTWYHFYAGPWGNGVSDF